MSANRVATLGVDTHKDLHVAVALNQLGSRLDVVDFPTDDAHHRVLWDWAAGFGELRQAGVEGASSFGYRLAQCLASAGVVVFEVNRTARRHRGKSDPVDAGNDARAALSGRHRHPEARTGPAGQLRAMLVARRSAVKSPRQGRIAAA